METRKGPFMITANKKYITIIGRRISKEKYKYYRYCYICKRLENLKSNKLIKPIMNRIYIVL